MYNRGYVNLFVHTVKRCVLCGAIQPDCLFLFVPLQQLQFREKANPNLQEVNMPMLQAHSVALDVFIM